MTVIEHPTTEHPTTQHPTTGRPVDASGIRTVADVLALGVAPPEAVAVSCAGVDTTWRELERAAARVTRALRARGLGVGDRVPVLAERGGDMVAAWLGVLRSGAAYVPLSLDTPGHRLAHVVAEVGARAALVDRTARGPMAAAAPGLELLDLADPDGGAEGAGTASDRPVVLGPEDPAVVIYTSGTTGRPKGVVIPHRGLLNHTLWWAADTGLTTGDRVLCTWGSAFDGATFDTFRTLVAGARLVYADDAERRDPRALLRLLAGPRGVTVVSMTPSMLRGVLDAEPEGPGQGGGAGQGRSALRSLTTAGEVLTRQLAAEAWERWSVPIRNLYGPTEGSCIGTFGAFDPASDEAPDIGLPVANTRVYVLGADREELPPGVPGEIYVAGSGVALGYLGQPERTAEAFVPDPFGDRPGALMYRTGDRGVVRPDGRLDCLGRADDQVKILGNRIEPQEIRKLVEEQPGVAAAAVHAVGTPPRLVAYLVLDRDAARDGALPTREAVLRPLLGWVASAVLPTEVYAVDRLPLTANDKVDFAALSGMHDRPLPHTTAGGGLTPRQREAAVLMAEAIAEGRPDGGAPVPDDLGSGVDFFTLGGHSLLAVRMLAAGERRHGVALPLRGFLADPTVAGLARMLDRATPLPGADLPVSDGRPDLGAGSHPATPVQQRLWFVDRIRDLRSAYVIPCLLEIRGAVQVEALRAALGEVLGRHPGLRSRFTLDRRARRLSYRTDGAAPPVTVVDAAAWTAGELAGHLGTRSWAPFDLAVEAPARAEVVLAADRVLVLLTMHHIVSDGGSVQIVLDQVGEAYRARLENRAAVLGRPVHPAEPAVGPGTPQAGRIEEYLLAWRDAPVDVALPFDRDRSGSQSADGAVLAVEADSGQSAGLRAFGRERGCTTFMTSALLLGVVLARRSGQRDQVFAFPWAGRDGVLGEGAVAMLVNTLLVRVDLTGDPTWSEALERVRRSATTAYRYADVPFDAVAAALHPDRGLDRPPVTPVYLTVEEEPMRLPRLGDGLTVGHLPPEPMKVKYELELTTVVGPGGTTYSLAYAEALFEPGTVRDLLGELVAAAAELTKDPDTSVFAASVTHPTPENQETQ